MKPGDDPLQLSLPPFQRHSDTSRDAAVSMYHPAALLRAKVERHILRCGRNGTTDDEAEVALDLIHQTYSPRRCELVDAGRVVATIWRRKNRSGRTGTVWVHADVAAVLPPEVLKGPKKEASDG